MKNCVIRDSRSRSHQGLYMLNNEVLTVLDSTQRFQLLTNSAHVKKLTRGEYVTYRDSYLDIEVMVPLSRSMPIEESQLSLALCFEYQPQGIRLYEESPTISVDSFVLVE